ncbi:MAG: hypothetical protein NC925_00370 [Candidatus Omnitrophica bacterium]|nr:hypothetical protein [Candidatus Omnitrophota bacterium]
MKESQMQIKYVFFLFLMLFIFPSLSFADSVKKEINLANKLYQEKKYDEALQKYNEAALKLPDLDILNFNIGATLYKRNAYNEAISYFTKSLASENKNLEADALYNIGNCNYRLGKSIENTNLETSIKYLQEALSYYKQAIQLNQKDNDARINYEFTKKQLELLLDRLNNKQFSEDKSQTQENKDNKQTSQENKATEQQQSKNLQNEKENQRQTEYSDSNEKDIKEQKEMASSKSLDDKQQKELTEEQARLLLDRYGKEQIPNYFYRRPTSKEEVVLKDW